MEKEKKYITLYWEHGDTPVISTLGVLRRDCKCEASLGYKVSKDKNKLTVMNMSPWWGGVGA